MSDTAQDGARLKRGLAGTIAHAFIDSPLTPLVILAALLLGAFSIWQTPREEEPQIVVPMLDVFVQNAGGFRRRSGAARDRPHGKNCFGKCPGLNTSIRSAIRA